MSLSHGLLGLLNYCPMAGYDLKKIFEDSIEFFWSAQTSQIYRELKSLEKAGFVRSHLEPGSSGPARRVYEITESGRDRLRGWLLSPGDRIDEDNRNEFLLRVFLSSSIGGDELLAMLRERLEKYRRDLERLKETESVIPRYKDRFDVERELLYWRISMSRGYHDVLSHIRWAEESIRLLEEQGFEHPR